MAPPGFHRGKGHVIDPKTRAKVVVLRDRHGLDFPTISERFGMSKATASTIYHEEKTKMKMENDNDPSNRQTKTMG